MKALILALLILAVGVLLMWGMIRLDATRCANRWQEFETKIEFGTGCLVKAGRWIPEANITVNILR